MERAMQTVGSGARAAMHHGNTPGSDMFNAILHQIFCINQRPHSANPGKRSPMSMWAGVNLKISERMMKGVLVHYWRWQRLICKKVGRWAPTNMSEPIFRLIYRS